MNDFRSWFWSPLVDQDYMRRLEEADRLRDYRQGVQRRQLKVRPGQSDDNIVMNLAGLIIDRSVSMLMGAGFLVDLPGDEETPEDRYIELVFRANNKDIFFQRVALLASEQGTGYIKIIPNARFDVMDGQEVTLPRLVAVDPAWVTMESHPDDVEDIMMYKIQYIRTNFNDEEEAYKQEITRNDEGADVVWDVVDYVANASTNGRWQEVGREVWPYSFPPIVHFQNLPNPISPYGVPDITDDVIELQDRLNFVSANVSKIIRYYAHPMRYMVNVTNIDSVDGSPDKILKISGNEADVRQLEQLGDLASSQEYMKTLQRTMYDITQTTDLTNVDVNAVTNFGLKLLFYDSLNKLEVKRALYGEAIERLVRSLLELNGMAGETPSIVWGDPLPVNELDAVNIERAKLEAGLISKQTAQVNLDIDPETEAERMAEEQTQSSNIGEMLLTAFTQGQ